MPFAFILVGLLLLVTAIRGTFSDLSTLIKGDFTGSNNFVYWTLSIIAIGAVGYVKSLKPFSNAFLLLVLIVLVISKQSGIFGTNGIMAQIKSHTVDPAKTLEQTSASGAFKGTQSIVPADQTAYCQLGLDSIFNSGMCSGTATNSATTSSLSSENALTGAAGHGADSLRIGKVSQSDILGSIFSSGSGSSGGMFGGLFGSSTSSSTSSSTDGNNSALKSSAIKLGLAYFGL